MLRRIGVDGLIDTTMNCEVGLAITFQVQPSNFHSTRDWFLDKAGIDRLAPDLS